MDSWYAAKALLQLIESLNTVYDCPLKSNRLVDDSRGQQSYHHVDSLDWSKLEQTRGKVIKLRGFPKEHKAKLFRVVASTAAQTAISRSLSCVVTTELAARTRRCTMELPFSSSC